MRKHTISKDRQRLISTTKLTDGQFETMVFPCVDGHVVDWGELRCERYDTPRAAILGHMRVTKEVNAEKR